jgi:signal-transduction protein with cAMP-binding, CBS, and nucleotidyltransferase domain
MGSRKDQPVKVRHVTTKKVATVSSRTTLVTGGRMMSEKKISCIIVQKKNQVLGIINTKSRFPDDLIRLSDVALYEAKKRGKNQIVCWNENMTE